MNENNALFYNFFKDLIEILKDKLVESNKEVRLSSNESDKLFNEGKLMGYHDVITIIQSQAIGFDVDLNRIGLSGFDADKFIV